MTTGTVPPSDDHQKARVYTLRVSANGQVTLPKSVRVEMGIARGGEVTFERLPSGEFVMRPTSESALALMGLLKGYAGERPVTTDEMNDAVAAAASEGTTAPTPDARAAFDAFWRRRADVAQDEPGDFDPERDLSAGREAPSFE
jgi:AbrB family looped-hinge helix DNA binding protein